MDRRLALDTANGIDIIGMLLTTPRWASTNPTAPDWYWYEPSNFNDYYDFVRAAVNRWRGQIHVWEIWNEPNHTGTWNCVNYCDHAADYARLLQGAYVTIKSVDPDARVLIGGLYIHDTNNEGMAFLNQVVNDSGGAINFDALSIHTYMPDRAPEAMRSDSLVQNFQYRLNIANAWINSHGGSPAEIWLTEDGRSTCNGCPYYWSEEDQASMLARMYGIALASTRVVQFDWFQFEDKFNNPADLYGGMSIVRDDFSTKPGYNAYKTAQSMLDGATFSGPGPQMIPGNNPHQPDNSDYIGFDYRFEAFVPEAKRQYGYYVLPILEADRLVGRLDPKFQRGRGVLEVRQVYWEPNVRVTRARRQRLEEALMRLAQLIGAEQIEWRR